MKQLSIALNILLFVLVGILFYLQLRTNKEKPVVQTKKTVDIPTSGNDKIGYFEMDSLQANYNYFKDGLSRIKERERQMNSELASREKAYQKKVAEWQKKGPTMSQAEADAAQRENMQLQQEYQTRRQTLEDGLAKQSMEFKKDIKQRIEDYLREYNKDKKFSYILSYEPDFIFYRDTTYNVTSDLIEGLNVAYKKKD